MRFPNLARKIYSNIVVGGSTKCTGRFRCCWQHPLLFVVLGVVVASSARHQPCTAADAACEGCASRRCRQWLLERMLAARARCLEGDT